MENETVEEKPCKPLPQEMEDKKHSADYNCSQCTQTDCFYWHFYNSENV